MRNLFSEVEPLDHRPNDELYSHSQKFLGKTFVRSYIHSPRKSLKTFLAQYINKLYKNVLKSDCY